MLVKLKENGRLEYFLGWIKEVGRISISNNDEYTSIQTRVYKEINLSELIEPLDMNTLYNQYSTIDVIAKLLNDGFCKRYSKR